MLCPKCGNVLKGDMYCDKCNEYITEIDTSPKKASAKWVKIAKFSIIALFLISFPITSCVFEKQQKKEYAENIQSEFNEIFHNYEVGNYETALFSIENFATDYPNEKQKIFQLDELRTEIETKIEEDLYSEISQSEDYDELTNKCRNYLDRFSDGKYVQEVTEKYENARTAYSSSRLEDARALVASGKYLEADKLLTNIINNDITPPQTLQEARDLKNGISDIVKYETPESVDIKTLLSNASAYNMKKVVMTTPVIVLHVDRERQSFVVVPVSSESVIGYDGSFQLEIYYGNMADKTRWGSISPYDEIRLNSISGRFRIYSNQMNSGYIDAENIR